MGQMKGMRTVNDGDQESDGTMNWDLKEWELSLKWVLDIPVEREAEDTREQLRGEVRAGDLGLDFISYDAVTAVVGIVALCGISEKLTDGQKEEGR